jgi:hypothetical protein
VGCEVCTCVYVRPRVCVVDMCVCRGVTHERGYLPRLVVAAQTKSKHAGCADKHIPVDIVTTGVARALFRGARTLVTRHAVHVSVCDAPQTAALRDCKLALG